MLPTHGDSDGDELCLGDIYIAPAYIRKECQSHGDNFHNVMMVCESTKIQILALYIYLFIQDLPILRLANTKKFQFFYAFYGLLKLLYSCSFIIH